MYFCSMRMCAGFFLILCVFASVLPVPMRLEIGKLPALWFHYQEHKNDDHTLSVINFWKKHYGDGYHAHRNAHDHSELPGKTGNEHQHTGCGCNQLPLLPPTLIVWTVSDAPVFRHRQPFSDPTRLSGTRIRDIWQPPKA